MKEKTTLASDMPQIVESVVGPATKEQLTIETVEDYTHLQSSITVLRGWKEQQEQERKLRRLVAIWVFAIISLQVVYIMVIVVLDSTSKITIDSEKANIFFPAMLAEIFGMGFTVTKYLFNRHSKDEILTFLNRYTGKQK